MGVMFPSLVKQKVYRNNLYTVGDLHIQICNVMVKFSPSQNLLCHCEMYLEIAGHHFQQQSSYEG